MATYEEYLSRGIDPVTARAWSLADSYDDDDYYTQTSSSVTLSAGGRNFPPEPDDDAGAREIEFHLTPAPHEVTGYDPSGLVGVQVDRNHTPKRLVLRDDWDETMPASGLESAIFTAYRAAWTIQYEQARTEVDPQESLRRGSLADITEGFWGTPRSPAILDEEVYAAIDRANRLITEMKNQASRQTSGRADAKPLRTLEVELDGHLMSACRVNAEWATRVSSGRLMDEFFTAVQRAKQRPQPAGLQQLKSEREAVMAELDSLARESLAALRSLARG